MNDANPPKGRLDYGLNARNKPNKNASSSRKKGLTSFGGDDSDSNDDDDNRHHGPSGARSDINREIAAEQAALRKRAEAAMDASSALDPMVYDYDGKYDSFGSGREASSVDDERKERSSGTKGQCRYISSLLKTAQRRNQEQEIVYERKIAKEQAAKDAELMYEGKEKFITSAYKRKLAEREEWAKEEKERERREEEEDVTKVMKGGNFLYGGFVKNVVLGRSADKGGENKGNSKESDDSGEKVNSKGDFEDVENAHSKKDYQHRDSSRQMQRLGSKESNHDSRDDFLNRKQLSLGSSKDNEMSVQENNQVNTRSQILSERAIKIREARKRYFQRRGVPTQ